jgi:uncharacterized protein YcnI
MELRFGMRMVILIVVFSFVLPVSAHVTVKPSQVGIGAFQTFTVGVPVERDLPTIAIRVVIPEDVEYVTPNVKPGWKITTQKSGVGEEAKVSEIIWTGGTIPAGQRDEFLFSAKVPASETTLVWKAYQTYQDGTVVSWDIAHAAQPKNAEGKDDFSKYGPYSETKVINDLTHTSAPAKTASTQADATSLTISIVALVFSAVAMSIAKRAQKTV